MRTVIDVVGWLGLIMLLLSALACFICIVLASTYRRQKPNRYASAAWLWAGAFVIFLILGPVYSECVYGFLDKPLVDAAGDGNLPKVKLLLANGADVNTEDEGGVALLEAAGNGHTDVVKFLLAHGANANQRGDYLGTYTTSANHVRPLEVAKKHPDIVKLLRAAGAKE